jgi:hypothetical protein
MICTVTKYDSGDKIKKNEMGWECRTCGGERRVAYRVLMEKPGG